VARYGALVVNIMYVKHSHFELTLLSTTFVELLPFLVVATTMNKIAKDAVAALTNGESVFILSDYSCRTLRL
jgi:hypothetical protein